MFFLEPRNPALPADAQEMTETADWLPWMKNEKQSYGAGILWEPRVHRRNHLEVWRTNEEESVQEIGGSAQNGRPQYLKDARI